MLKAGLAALERGKRSVREQLGRTAVAYAVLVVGLLLTGLAYYYVRHNVEQAERERASRRSCRPPSRRWTGACTPT